MYVQNTSKKEKLFLTGTLFLVLTLAASFIWSAIASAALTTSSLGLSDSRPSQTAQYTLTSSGFNTGQTIGCIEVDMGTASDGSGTVPGLNTNGSTFVSQSITGSGTWTADNSASADQKLRFTNTTPVVPQSGSRTAVWGGVVNGSTADTPYFAKITTYTTSACTTPVDTTAVHFIYTDGTTVTAIVDPSLSFTVAGATSGTSCNGATSNVTTTATTVPFGTVTTASNKIGVQNLTVTTNSGNGYTVYARYTGPLTSGANTIDDMTGASNTAPAAFPSAGTEAYGYTTNSTTLGTGTANRFSSNLWAPFTTTNAEVAHDSTAVTNQTTCVGQQVGVSGTTPAGTYTTTVTYTATPVY